MTLEELINKSVLKPDPVRDNMDGTYTIKVKRIAKITTTDLQKQRPFQVIKYFITTCDVCGESCPKRLTKEEMFKQRTYCTQKCFKKMQIEMNRRSQYLASNGWRVKSSYHGYMVKRIWDDPNFKQGEWVTQHRYNMSKHLGRKLLKNEVVHHIDMDKTNNNIDNLWLCNTSAHTKTKKLQKSENGIFYLPNHGLSSGELIEFTNDGDNNPSTTNNNIDNLWLCNTSAHTKAHGSMNGYVKVLFNLGLVIFDTESGKYILTINLENLDEND